MSSRRERAQSAAELLRKRRTQVESLLRVCLGLTEARLGPGGAGETARAA